MEQNVTQNNNIVALQDLGFRLDVKVATFLKKDDVGSYADVIVNDGGAVTLGLDDGMTKEVPKVSRGNSFSSQFGYDLSNPLKKGDKVYFDTEGKAVQAFSAPVKQKKAEPARKSGCAVRSNPMDY